MVLEVLKSKIYKTTLGQTRIQAEKTVKEHFVRWSHGGTVLSLPQFRMALSELGVPARTAEDIFSELDQGRRGSIPIQQVLANVIEVKPPPDRSLQSRSLEENRSASALDLSRSREPQSPVPSSPAGRRSLPGVRGSSLEETEALRQKKIRIFWDLIGNRAWEKGYKSAAQVLRAMDKDDDKYLDRMEARKFFKFNLCLAVSKADEFFNLLDEDRDGKVSCQEISRCLAPYLQKSFQTPEVPNFHDDQPGRATMLRDQELRKFWDMLGRRAVDRGFKSVGQMFLQIDKDDNGVLDRKEMASFLVNYVGFASTGADRFFDMLDVDKRGKVSCKDIRRCLEPYFSRTYDNPAAEVPEFRNARDAAVELEEREEEMKRFWDLIGKKFFEKGYRSAGQVLMVMDRTDSQYVDRSAVRMFFEQHLGHGSASADRFFDLLDVHGRGVVATGGIKECLAPYFQSTFRDPHDVVGKWEPAPPEPSSFAPAGRTSGALSREGAATGRRIVRQASMPAYPPQSAQDSLRSSRGYDGEPGVPPAGAATPLASPVARGQRRSMTDLGESLDEVPVGQSMEGFLSQAGPPQEASIRSFNSDVNSDQAPSAVPDLDLSSSRRSLDMLSASRRSLAMREEAPLPQAQSSPAAGGQTGRRQDMPAAGRPQLTAARPPPGQPASGASVDRPAAGRPQLAAAPSPPPAPSSGSSVDRPAAGRPQLTTSPQPCSSAGAVDLSGAVVAEFRRALLARKGMHGIHQFGRTFRIMDTSGNMQVSAGELDVASRRFGLDIKEKDLALLMHAIDQDGSGTISCTEFLRAIRGPMSARRQALVDLAFNCLDRNHNGRIELQDLQQIYDVSQHPDVVSKKISQEMALEDFLSQFEGTTRDGILTKKEFSEYYANLSASIDDDNYFELMMRSSWRGGHSWPVPLVGQGHAVGPLRDDFVPERPRRQACWIGRNGELQ